MLRQHVSALQWLIAESLPNTEEIATSLDKIARFKGGLWASEKQGRFLQNFAREFDDPEAKAWAHKNGYKGHAFSLMKKLGYAKSDPTKIRYVACVYVVDAGGIVATANLKVKHPTATDPDTTVDWSTAKLDFERKDAPSVTVDIDAERSAAVANNKPTMDLIRTIPDWENVDILVSFMDQLKRGRELSFRQQDIVQKLLPPEAQASLGDRKEWAALYDRFKAVFVRALEGKAAASKIHEKEFGDAYAQTKAAGKWWRWREPIDPEKEAQTWLDVAKEVREKGYASEWIDAAAADEVLRSFDEFARVKRPDAVLVATDGAGVLAGLMTKVVASKKPTKKGLDALQYCANVVKRIGDWTAADFEKKYLAQYRKGFEV